MNSLQQNKGNNVSAQKKQQKERISLYNNKPVREELKQVNFNSTQTSLQVKKPELKTPSKKSNIDFVARNKVE
jgi:hypothetical protein